MAEAPDVSGLSQRARLAIALHLFHGYCDGRGLHHPEIDRYLAHLWEFVGLYGDPGAFSEWVGREPDLTHVGLGDPYPPPFAAALAAAGVAEAEFRRALEFCTEVLYISMYGACNEPRTREFLAGLAGVAVPLGARWPDLAVFAGSRWADAGGWGRRPSAEELARWRPARHAEPGAAPDDRA
ncbi:hypothetical protein [Tuwongella immobilis]|uniref:Uncharacterized protein n=1 Tax=Tuwongella immobilis TaxID=692036 RepID=A0A6C2YVB6_9BACT|nr:hypothetical protein [Tuwongella immobilis]VIP05113.1 Uncharacterized protein OS=Vibrio caribbeanicus ATCC BAA-2122 GN=VIBC2010_17235 PE=4 SV=1 [Tuwongella immobilis]VTS07582.1 Uncharacterized protein OS=Vibrio caribbeanicus ATCC BAA-2122 GN=VIBC2010_17235 PE=4 SV=1 [Tuwongella immobilis]